MGTPLLGNTTIPQIILSAYSKNTNGIARKGPNHTVISVRPPNCILGSTLADG